MSSEIGKILRIQVFGESHGSAIGAVMSGFPCGFTPDLEELSLFMQRRKPGGYLTTKRNEEDKVIFLSGIKDGKTCGSPICIIIENTDSRSSDYNDIYDTPRPSHADFTARKKYGEDIDLRGGGHFSGRLTAPLCAMGAIAKQYLNGKKISIAARLFSVGDAVDESSIRSEIEKAAADNDSVGGVIECTVDGLPVGIGGLMFGGVESRISQAIFGIPGIKGIEFGSGFAGSKRCGSENNDPFVIKDGQIKTSANNSGGILGGITNGMPVVFRVAVKPTPSIGKEQKTVNTKTMTEQSINIVGRHDPCIAVRAVPVVEALTALVMLDMILEDMA